MAENHWGKTTCLPDGNYTFRAKNTRDVFHESSVSVALSYDNHDSHTTPWCYTPSKDPLDVVETDGKGLLCMEHLLEGDTNQWLTWCFEIKDGVMSKQDSSECYREQMTRLTPHDQCGEGMVSVVMEVVKTGYDGEWSGQHMMYKVCARIAISWACKYARCTSLHSISGCLVPVTSFVTYSCN